MKQKGNVEKIKDKMCRYRVRPSILNIVVWVNYVIYYQMYNSKKYYSPEAGGLIHPAVMKKS